MPINAYASLWHSWTSPMVGGSLLLHSAVCLFVNLSVCLLHICSSMFVYLSRCTVCYFHLFVPSMLLGAWALLEHRWQESTYTPPVGFTCGYKSKGLVAWPLFTHWVQHGMQVRLYECDPLSACVSGAPLIGENYEGVLGASLFVGNYAGVLGAPFVWDWLCLGDTVRYCVSDGHPMWTGLMS